tara:strand:- start:159 stop:692 length:534 start_codon:yes stop_codon:yes gene_type:complete
MEEASNITKIFYVANALIFLIFLTLFLFLIKDIKGLGGILFFGILLTLLFLVLYLIGFFKQKYGDKLMNLSFLMNYLSLPSLFFSYWVVQYTNGLEGLAVYVFFLPVFCISLIISIISIFISLLKKTESRNELPGQQPIRSKWSRWVFYAIKGIFILSIICIVLAYFWVTHYYFFAS